MTYVWENVRASGNRTSCRFSQLALGNNRYLEVRPDTAVADGPKKWRAELVERTPTAVMGLWGQTDIIADNEAEARDIALRAAITRLDFEFRQSYESRKSVIDAWLNLNRQQDSGPIQLSEHFVGEICVDADGLEPTPVEVFIAGATVLAITNGKVSREAPICYLIPDKYLTDSGCAGGDTMLNRKDPEATAYLDAVMKALISAKTGYAGGTAAKKNAVVFE